MVTETDLPLTDGRTLHVYDTAEDATDARLVAFWHHGTPNIGAPPEPLLEAAARRGIRCVSYDRPGYGGSSPLPGRDVASAAADVSSIADALGLQRFAAIGHSGGGPRALACGAFLPERVLGVVSISGLAPFGADGLDWFTGMAPSGEAELRAAIAGREALQSFLHSSEYDPELFTPADHAALDGPWSWLLGIVGEALKGGTSGMVDDDLAYVAAWGFDPEQVSAPVLVMQGTEDRIVPSSHAEWLARRCPSAELRLSPGDGHVSILNSAVAALDWLRQQADRY